MIYAFCRCKAYFSVNCQWIRDLLNLSFFFFFFFTTISSDYYVVVCGVNLEFSTKKGGEDLGGPFIVGVIYGATNGCLGLLKIMSY